MKRTDAKSEIKKEKTEKNEREEKRMEAVRGGDLGLRRGGAEHQGGEEDEHGEKELHGWQTVVL